METKANNHKSYSAEDLAKQLQILDPSLTDDLALMQAQTLISFHHDRHEARQAAKILYIIIGISFAMLAILTILIQFDLL
ncbi:MAG: hypothetical protein ACOYUZ_04105 [Patescibacteria group bacterium]